MKEKEKKKLSMSQEDYLEKIYLLQLNSNDVRVTDIARALKISKPSVNRAISSLCDGGYLTHEHYGTIVLTEAGKKVGENVYESHKIIRKFLVDFLGVEEDVAEKEACLMEHAISKGTRKKWKKYMKKQLKEIKS